MAVLNQEATSFPEWIVPMAATLTEERFTGPDWIFEQKLDGIRMLAFRNGADVKLYSRNRLLQHYPAVADAIASLPPKPADSVPTPASLLPISLRNV